jgi:hypothetical protein
VRVRLRAFAARGALAIAVLAGIAYIGGARYTRQYAELRCTEGQTAQPVSVAPVYVCRAQPATDHRWPRAVAVEDRVALYLVHVHIRIFDVDRVWGTSHFFALNVPSL